MPKPLDFTFGNHMHWVDMQWLWGYDVLPSSVRDMLHLCRETGAKGNVNFDGIGYEKMAAECPEALAELRRAVEAGTVEVVGASYGQPYGLFHGGESNIRQRVYGARSVRRLLGVWPRTFWEEEFDFFPQLPQILAGCGFTGASLFFQWTWHTPTVPEEDESLVWWEGMDGTRLLALPKNELCLHQWPEDFAGRLEGGAIESLEHPALVQWLELLPSPDWMCRSELLLPNLRELIEDPRFELRCRTLGELIASQGDAHGCGPSPQRRGQAPRPGRAPIRAYTLDDVFHGMSLGKNADAMPRFSRVAEELILAAEVISTLAGSLGRPYPHWDVYPTWELEEAWRELLSAQHHDNHECEALCGFIGEHSFHRALGLAEEVWERSLEMLARRSEAPEGHVVVFNPLGWTRDVIHEGEVVREVPAYGYRVIDPDDELALPHGEAHLSEDEEGIFLERGDLRVRIDRATGTVTQFQSAEFPEGLLRADRPLGDLGMLCDGRPENFDAVSLAVEGDDEDFVQITTTREGRGGSLLRITYDLSPSHRALWIRIQAENLARPDGGAHAGLQTAVEPAFDVLELRHDHPYGVSGIRAEGVHRRKYPSGAWMTSPQWYEEVRRPFTAASFVDQILDNGKEDHGLLVVHDGAQGFFRTDTGVRQLLNAYDPWDEGRFGDMFSADLWFMPHGPLSDTERIRMARECLASSPRFPVTAQVGESPHAVEAVPKDMPTVFGTVSVDAPNVLCTASYRESRRSAEYVEGRFEPECRDPHVLRLVEYDGRRADVTVRVPGVVAAAARTDLLGRVLEELEPESVRGPWGSNSMAWSALRISVRPHEIVTLMFDSELTRQIPRNLDEHRGVWATAHRRGEAVDPS